MCWTQRKPPGAQSAELKDVQDCLDAWLDQHRTKYVRQLTGITCRVDRGFSAPSGSVVKPVEVPQPADIASPIVPAAHREVGPTCSPSRCTTSGSGPDNS